MIKKMKPSIFYLNDTDLSNNGKSTIVVGDGISYATNAASIIRNCGILGATEYYFCPLDVERFNIIKSEAKAESDEKQILSFGYNDKKIIVYNAAFRKSVKKYSMDFYEKNIIHFQYSIENVIEVAKAKNYTIIMLESFAEADIYKSKNILDKQRVMIIVGNEKMGVGKFVKKLYEDGEIKPLFIPSCIELNSLNVSYAAVIAVYERNKQNPCFYCFDSTSTSLKTF